MYNGSLSGILWDQDLPVIHLVTDEMATGGCCCAACQAPIQAFIRPAVWIPGIRNLHSRRERWIIEGATPERCLEDVAQAVEKVKTGEHLVVHRMDKTKNFIQIFSLTKANWLDVVEIKFQATSAAERIEAEAYSFSSGFLPVCCPLSFLFNAIFCIAPFTDRGLNERRLKELRSVMDEKPTSVEIIKRC